MVKRVLQQAVSGIVLFFLSASVASATTFYVRTDGNNSNTGTANTSAGAWLTITYAAAHVTAGDVVRVQAGTYVETPAIGVSGASGNTVTIVADGAVTACGLTFSGKSYVRIIGLTLDGNASGCTFSSSRVSSSGTNTGLEFWNVAVTNTSGKGYDFGNGSFDGNGSCNSCIWIGGSVSNVGNPASNYGMALTGNDDFVGYVSLSTICYIGIAPDGLRQRFVGLVFSGMVQCGATHPDFFYINIQGSVNPYSNGLIESVYGLGTPTASDNKFFHAQNDPASGTWADDVWRFNVAHNMGSDYISMYDTSAAISRWRHYNNTLVNCERGASNNQCGAISASGGHGTSVWIYNNLLQNGWAQSSTSTGGFPVAGGSPSITMDYNLAYSTTATMSFSSPWSGQGHPKNNVDPKLNNESSEDLTLGAASGARGAGTALTTASGSGTNSTSLTVAANTGSFFIGSNVTNLPQYGGNLVPGDFITVGSTTVQVSSVSGDTLTLVSPISWSSGAPVYFGSSSTIDIGAYPYKSGGYAVSANLTSGANETITPNDASLVRFVVCYSDNVPYAVVNSSPYTCAVPAGTFSARVYPRYASQTRWATAGSSAPSAPTGLRIVG